MNRSHSTRKFLRKQLRDLSGRSRRTIEKWGIGVIAIPAQDLVRSKAMPPVTWLHAPAGRFYADPFAIVVEGRAYVFFEDYDYRKPGGARISVVETEGSKTFGEVRTAMEQPFHLSYPYMIEHEGRYYMVPEQWQSGEVAIYEAEAFPTRWAKRATLISDFPGIDPTIIRYEGRWWMFLGHKNDDEDGKLYVYHADSLFGPWEPHAANPVKAEPQISRSGGTPFLIDGRLIRPVQDSSKTYGGGLFLNEVVALSESKFEERYFDRLQPDATWPYPHGLHTLTALNGSTLIDAKRRMLVRDYWSQVVWGKSLHLAHLLGRTKRSQ